MDNVHDTSGNQHTAVVDTIARHRRVPNLRHWHTLKDPAEEGREEPSQDGGTDGEESFSKPRLREYTTVEAEQGDLDAGHRGAVERFVDDIVLGSVSVTTISAIIIERSLTIARILGFVTRMMCLPSPTLVARLASTSKAV